MTRATVAHEVLIASCATSAGIHAALVPVHLEEGLGAGFGFIAATAFLAVVAVGLTLGAGAARLGATAAVLAGLLASYGLAVTTGLPLLHPEPEAVDALGLATKAVELAGLLAAGHLLLRGRLALAIPRPKGTTT